jgi:two-component system sensor histidine kinase QseC
VAQKIIESYPAGDLISHGDADLIGIAIRNLLDNAIRYTQSEHTVWLEASTGADGYTLSVRDNGPGVAPESLARLGERFFRGRETTTEGNGLGLAIVSRVAELHGARFEVANAPGRRLRGAPERPAPGPTPGCLKCPARHGERTVACAVS